MKKIYVTKKYLRMLDVLGYKGNEKPTYDEVAEWLMERNYYVMPLPEPNYLWEVGVVILGKPNTQDLKLNRCSVASQLTSIEKAQRHGVEFVLKSLYDAEKLAKRHIGDKEYSRRLREELLAEGFDV